MAGPFHGHLLEFPLIRVDCFTTPRNVPRLPVPGSTGLRTAPPARLFLLTHVHSDHLQGLTGDFTGTIVCSEATKRMLPQLEEEKARINLDSGKTELRKAKYAGLQPRAHPHNRSLVLDPIEGRPYGVPKEYNLGYYDGKEVKVTITLFPANHCLGSTMFLITSAEHAVLHTGDIRADDNFIRSLKSSPLLQPYLAIPDPGLPPPERHRRLERIYIDTSALNAVDVPLKEPVLDALVALIDNYPPDMTFFFNIWTLGWEDILKAVANKFNTPVHVDRYKRRLFEAAADEELLHATTVDPSASRFHACERFLPCEHSKPRPGRLAVRVEMAEYELVPWDLNNERAFRSATNVQAAPENEHSFLDVLSVPLARHSTIPELKRLVDLFRPVGLVPNTVPSKEPHTFAKATNVHLKPDHPWPHFEPASSLTATASSVHGEGSTEASSSCHQPGVPLPQMPSASLESIATTSTSSRTAVNSVPAPSVQNFTASTPHPDPGTNAAIPRPLDHSGTDATPQSLVRKAPDDDAESADTHRNRARRRPTKYPVDIAHLAATTMTATIDSAITAEVQNSAPSASLPDTGTSVTIPRSLVRSGSEGGSEPADPGRIRARRSTQYPVNIAHLQSLLRSPPSK